MIRQLNTLPRTKTRRLARTWRDVLVLDVRKKSQATVRRYYLLWRQESGLPLRCDNTKCRYHAEPLSWNGSPLPLILDHVEGNRYDNSPRSLRLLCPNCDAQLGTRGGANRGRVVEVLPEGYTLRNKDGSRVIARRGVSLTRSYAAAVGIAWKQESK